MATCHALAQRGHDVTLVVRPDSARRRAIRSRSTASPRSAERCSVQAVCRRRSHGRARRLRFLLPRSGMAALAAAMRRTHARPRPRGVAAAAAESRRPRSCYESHGMRRRRSPRKCRRCSAKPDLAPSPRKLRRLDRREDSGSGRTRAGVRRHHAGARRRSGGALRRRGRTSSSCRTARARSPIVPP